MTSQLESLRAALADRYALERTRMPLAYKRAFVKLARLNKCDPDPHPVVVWFFEDHPPIKERLAMADAILVDAASELAG